MRGCVAFILLFVLGISAVPSINKKDSRPTIPLTKRSNVVKDGFVDMDVLKDHVNYVKYKYANLLATYERNTGKPHPIARVGTTVKRQTGSVPLKDYNSQLWYGPITIGGQNFTVDFDTGSSDLFIPGLNCTLSCTGHNRFNTIGATDTGTTFTTHFADNSTTSGEVFTDSVTLGGLTAKTQAFGVADQYSTGFQIPRFPADGLMGMSYPDFAQITATKPFFNTLIQDGAVSAGKFGFKLSSTNSVLYLGGVDPSSSSGQLNTLNITRPNIWIVSMDSVDVSGSAAVSNLSAVIDTGTNFIVGDPTSVSQFYSSIPGAKDAGDGFFTFPCNSPPKVSMTFNGVSYDISSTFNIGRRSITDCLGGITALDNGLTNIWIAGDVFLQNVYAEFSFDDNTVGFSLQA